ncbi:MAG: hypothetical protein HXX19_20555, partial [Rhodoferax sp.]|nr:hypothetical protein [Rhodoferax sp.]
MGPANSLVGTTTDDQVGTTGFRVLNGNSNVLIGSGNWGSLFDTSNSGMGAVTWMNGATGKLADGSNGGPVSAVNSFVGTANGDRVGYDNNCECDWFGAKALSDGNYVVNSRNAGAGGAVSWGDGATGLVGTISAANSVHLQVDNSRIIESPSLSGHVVVASGSAASGAGAVYVVGASGGGAMGSGFADSPTVDATIGASWISNALTTANVALQANNDITVNSAISVVPYQIPAGNLTLRAGRYVTLNAPISTGGGNLVVVANDAAALSANRDAGGGGFVNNAGSTALNVGSGRWLVYSSDPTHVTKSGLSSNFRHYNATYANYASPSESGNGFIYGSSPGTLSVNVALSSGSASNTYGTAPTAVFGYTLSGFADSEDTVSNIGLAGTPLFDHSFLASTNAGSYVQHYTGGLSTGRGYTLAIGNGLDYTVNKANVTLNAPIVSKTYDGGLGYITSAADLSALSAALVGGDLVTAATLAYTNKNAGTGNKAVTLSGVTVDDGNGGNNYNITLAGNTTSTINKASVTLTAPVVSKTYDGTT